MGNRYTSAITPDIRRNLPTPQTSQSARSYRRTSEFPDEVGSRGEIEFSIELPLTMDQLDNQNQGWFSGANCRIPDETVRLVETAERDALTVNARTVVNAHSDIEGTKISIHIGPKLEKYRRSVFRDAPTIYSSTYREPLRPRPQILFEEQAAFETKGDSVVIPHFATVLWNTSTNVKRNLQFNAFGFSDDRFRVYSLVPHPTNGNVLIGIIAPNTDDFDPVTMNIHPGAVPPGTCTFIGGGSYPAQRTFAFGGIEETISVRADP